LDGFGCLIPRNEKLPLLGVIWASSLLPGRVPPGQCLLSCYIGGAHHPEIAGWPPENVQQLVLDNLQSIFKTPALSPTFSRVLNYEKAIPQYTLGHRERIETIENELDKTQPGLFVCGNYLHGIALNECVKSGQAAADQVLSLLR
jgi:oxygen-dependent protoporphyrinogen oxidase